MSEVVNAGSERTFSPVLIAVVVALLLLLAIASLGSYRDMQSALQRQGLLEERIEATRQRNEQLANEIDRLQDDPAAIERLAREQYRMMKPGDVILVLPEEPATKVEAASPTAAEPSSSPPEKG